MDADTLRAALIGFQQKREEIDRQMAEINAQLKGTNKPKAVKAARKHRMSPEGRKRIAEAQRLRWRKVHRAKKAA